MVGELGLGNMVVGCWQSSGLQSWGDGGGWGCLVNRLLGSYAVICVNVVSGGLV